LKFSFGSAHGYNVNGLYADVQFNYAAGAYATTDDVTYQNWFDSNVGDHPTITPLEIDLGIIALKAVKASVHEV
jgi:hypothetical protein